MNNCRGKVATGGRQTKKPMSWSDRGLQTPGLSLRDVLAESKWVLVFIADIIEKLCGLLKLYICLSSVCREEKALRSEL